MSVISAWSAVSPYGIGVQAMAAGLPAAANRTPVEPDLPPAGVVPDFEPRVLLGTKGTRWLDRVSALAVVATGEVVAGAGDLGEEPGLVLGVNNGSAQSMVELTRDSMVKARPEFVKPAQFPNTLMNSAAAQCAIWHRLRGPNATLAAGRTSGLFALRYALRLQRAGRAEAVLCGAAEEYSTSRAWLAHHAAPGPGLGEGCAMLLLEPPGRPAGHGRTGLAEVAGLAFGVFDEPGSAGVALDRCVRRVLATTQDPVWAHAAAHDPALPEVDVAADAEVRLPMTELLGDTHAASAALAVAAVLALAETAPGRPALVTALDRDGTVGAALLRICPERPA